MNGCNLMRSFVDWCISLLNFIAYLFICAMYIFLLLFQCEIILIAKYERCGYMEYSKIKKYIHFICVSVSIFCTQNTIASEDDNKENVKPALSLIMPECHVQRDISVNRQTQQTAHRLHVPFDFKRKLYIPRKNSSNTTTFLSTWGYKLKQVELQKPTLDEEITIVEKQIMRLEETYNKELTKSMQPEVMTDKALFLSIHKKLNIIDEKFHILAQQLRDLRILKQN